MKAAATDLPALKLLTVQRPLVIGHRGYARIAPENTLPSFKLAVAAGADVVELDYHHSKDQVPVVIHDSTLDRTTDAIKRWGGKRIRVAAKTASELQQLDAGAWFDPQFAGTKLPLLAEAVDAIQAAGGLTMIEHKSGDAATAVKLLRKLKLINRVVVHSFNWQYLREFHELEPVQVLGALGPPEVLADGRRPKVRKLGAKLIAEMKLTGVRIAGWNQDVTKASVTLAHQHGLKVWIYTVDDVALANRLLEAGVDGLISNDPVLVRRTLAVRNAR